MNDWNDYFIQTGTGGSSSYKAAMDLSSAQISALLENISKPYSGLDAFELDKQISKLSLDRQEVVSLSTVIIETADIVAKNSIIVQHPHCIAHLHTPPLIAGIVAENFISAQNLSMDSWDQSAAATFVEQHVVNWLCKTFELGANSDGVFTSGGTQSNIMALLMARDWAAKTFSNHNVQSDGLPDYAKKMRILCSENSHFTVKKAASLMGLGENSVICVSTNIDGSMYTHALEEEIIKLKKTGFLPFAIVGTAGTTDHGAIDNLSVISRIANEHKLWFHVDAAYGGALILSNSKHRLSGIECADSVTIDFHKLWFQPVSCSAVLVKEKTSFKSFLYHADYLNREHDDLPNLVDKTISTTRRFDALKLLLSLRTIGTSTLGAMIDHLLKQARDVAELIESKPEFELLAQPSLSTILFRYTGLSETKENFKNQLNKDLRVQLLKSGNAVLGETVVDNKVALKLTILNPCLTRENFLELLNKIITMSVGLHNSDKAFFTNAATK